MPHNKQYRGPSRKQLSKNVSDNKLVEDRANEKTNEKNRTDIERHLFEQSMGIKTYKIRFDYTDNVMSLRGDWKSKIGVIKLFLPFIVNKNKCKKFEEMINNAFETIFLET